MLIFLRVLGYTHKMKSSKPIILVVTSLVNHHPVNIISKTRVCWQPGLSALSQWHDTIHLQKRGVYLWNAIVTKHLALTIWHSNIYWNDNVYWMVIDKWCHNQNLVWKILGCGRIQVLWRKLTEKLDLIRHGDKLGDPNFRSSQGQDKFERKKERKKEKKQCNTHLIYSINSVDVSGSYGNKLMKRKENWAFCAFCRRAIRAQ